MVMAERIPRCAWYAGCPRPAARLRDHIPICERCDLKVAWLRHERD